jgi:hypothetical protein
MVQAWRAPAAVLVALMSMAGGLLAQGRGGAQGPPPTGKAAAPIDVTGYWVAEITEDWRWRMVTPPKGDSASLPMTPAAVAVANAWDPKKDEAAGEQCKAYGAPGLMRGPTRLHITWQDDNTLRVDTDYGQQTRLFHFGEWRSPGGAPTWQGESTARWVTPAGAPIARGANTGSLDIVTTRLRPGYLRKNGIPYSANTVFNETWDVIPGRNGEARLLMLLRVTDPMYLRVPWVVSVHFKKEPDGSKWNPSACSSTW